MTQNFLSKAGMNHLALAWKQNKDIGLSFFNIVF
jgi:hypothetical protein